MTELHVRQIGTHGPPLVFIHGFAGNAATWRPWVGSLSKDHSLHLVDLKGFGDAPRPRDGRYSPIDLARPVVRYVRERKLEGVTLIGHSLGGAVALIVALELFEHARAGSDNEPARLVIVSGAAFPQAIPPFIRLAGSRGVGGVVLRAVPMRWLIKKALEKVYFDPSAVRRDQVLAYADPIRRPGGRYAIRMAAKQLIPEGTEQIVARYGDLAVPALLLWGRHDRVVPLDVGRQLSVVLPRSELRILEECGHIPSEELPERSLSIVRDFLGRTSAELAPTT